MTTIFTIFVCLTFANPASARYNSCGPPTDGLTYYQSEAECQRLAAYYTKVDADPYHNGGAGMAVKQEWRCFKKAVNTWSPAD